MNNKKIIIYSIVVIAISGVIFLIMPVVIQIYRDMSNYSKRVEQSYDYTKITAPLPAYILEDICSKFQFNIDDRRCTPNAITYAPDFYDDIEKYFSELPGEKATFQTVQDKLGNYLVRCEEPDDEGNFACRYDIRGDGIYPILIFYTKEGFYYRVIANTGGS